MDMKDQQEPPDLATRNIGAWLVLIFYAIASPVEMLVRKPGTAGVRYFSGPKMLLAFFCPLMACAFLPPTSPQEWQFVLYMTALYPFAAGVHRTRGKLLRWRGYQPHSMYSGDSALPGSPTWAKSTAEPLFTIVLGAVACLVSPPLGAYLIAAGICLGITSMHVGRRDRAIADAMRDAELEQAHYADLYERSKRQ